MNRTADFAARVQDLRQRSGLSYGALARHLKLSTSTLHRYCNGDAVPKEFAPIDRLARACRASDDELMDLHRLWMLADAERAMKGQEVDQAQAPAVSGTPVDASAVRAEADSPTDDSVLLPSSASPFQPAAYDVTPAHDQQAVRGTARRPVGKRRALSGMVVVAAAVVVGLTSAGIALPLIADHRDDEKPSLTGAVVAPDNTSTTSRGVVPRTAPSPSRSSDVPTRKSTPRTSSPATDRTVETKQPASTGAGGTTDAAKDIPVGVVVRPFTWESPCSQRYLIKAEPADVPPRPQEQDAPGWVSALGGISAFDQRIALTVQGTGKDTVVLENLRVQVVGSDPPPAWNEYTMGEGCGGNVDTKELDVNLDKARPVVKSRSGKRGFPFTVSESDPHVLYVNAATTSHDVRWYLELEWTSGDRHGVLRVDDQGKPFHTSASFNRPSYVWEFAEVDGWRKQTAES